jgi:hypothetical protein
MNESRRQFTRQSLGSLLTFSLLETLYTRDLFADEIKPLAAAWLAELNQASQDVKGQPLKQVQWQEKIEALNNKIDLADLMKFLDFEKLIRDVPFAERGERSLRPKLPKVEGLPTDLVFGHQIFALKKDRSVVPHGHNNLASSFLILKGDFHGRHFDKLEDEGDSMIIKPTIDRTFSPGEYSTVSDFRDNVHWFTATSDTAFIFNIHVLNLQTGNGRRGGRVYIDPNGEKLSDGRIRAAKLKSSEAFRRFG